MTFDRDTAVQQVAVDVTALVDSRKHVEPFYEWVGRNRKMRAWPTVQPSLLQQMRALVAEPAVAERDEGSARSVPKSRSPLGEDALDRLMAIEAATTWWASVRLRRDLRVTVEDNLRLLVGAAVRLEDADLRDLHADVHRWYGWAATVAGWQSPPWRPRAACPLCERKGTLRVLLDRKRATCLGCGEVWSEDDGSIGLLADYIREIGEQRDVGASA